MNFRLLVPFVLITVICVGLVITLLPRPAAKPVVTFSIPVSSPTPAIQTFAPTKPEALSTPTPSVSSDELPPIFPGLTIKSRQEGVMFQTEDPKGPSEVKGTVVEANILNEKGTEKIDHLIDFYDSHFNKLEDWINYTAGDGPLGSTYAWKKNDKYFIFIINRDIQSGKMLSAFIRYN